MRPVIYSLITASLLLACSGQSYASMKGIQNTSAHNENIALRKQIKQKELRQHSTALVNKLNTGLGELHSKLAQLQKTQHTPQMISELQNTLQQLMKTVDKIERSLKITSRKGPFGKSKTSSTLSKIRTTLNSLQEDISYKDKMGNFDVQEMMSRAARARNLASYIKKKLDSSDEANSGDHPG